MPRRARGTNLAPEGGDMAIRKIVRSDWLGFVDRTSERLVGKRVAVEVASLDIGAQMVAEWVPLVGMVYDPGNDVLEVALEGLDHLIYAPREVYVDDMPLGTMNFAVTDGDGVLQIIMV